MTWAVDYIREWFGLSGEMPRRVEPPEPWSEAPVVLRDPMYVEDEVARRAAFAEASQARGTMIGVTLAPDDGMPLHDTSERRAITRLRDAPLDWDAIMRNVAARNGTRFVERVRVVDDAALKVVGGGKGPPGPSEKAKRP